MKKIIILSVLVLFASSAYAVSFSPLEMLQQESQNDSSGRLSSVIGKYNPEDFITCSITGNPEVVKGKANTFRVNAEITFNTEMYYNDFIPEVMSALDELSEKTRKTSGYLLEINDRPAPFGPKFYAFSENNTQKVSEILAGFRRKALRLQGVSVILQDANMKALHKINKTAAIQYFILEVSEGSNRSVWKITPSIVNFNDERRAIDSKLIIPVEFEIPSAILSEVRNMKAELMIEPHEIVQKRQGWLGVSVIDVTKQKADYSGLPTTEGAMINSVARGGSAEKAGLKRGDVVLMLNAERIINGVTFAQKIGTFKEGDTITMILNREGKTYNLRIKLGARPE